MTFLTRLCFTRIHLFPFLNSLSNSKLDDLSKLLLDDVLESDGISSELADTLAELLDGHLILVEVEAESRLIVDVGLLLEVKRSGLGGIELLGDGLAGVEEFLKKVGLRKVCEIGLFDNVSF